MIGVHTFKKLPFQRKKDILGSLFSQFSSTKNKELMSYKKIWKVSKHPSEKLMNRFYTRITEMIHEAKKQKEHIKRQLIQQKRNNQKRQTQQELQDKKEAENLLTEI